MAHTDIVLKNADGIFVPSQSQVPVVKGDTITFSTSDGSQVAIFFSSEAVPVLSPSPAVPTVLAAGKKLSLPLPRRRRALTVYFSS